MRSTAFGNFNIQTRLCLAFPPEEVLSLVQWYLGLRVTWAASVLQDEQTFLIHFNLINERCLAIRVLYYLYALSAECHVITSRSGLWVIVSHAQSQPAFVLAL
jgi:hypothetical protein